MKVTDAMVNAAVSPYQKTWSASVSHDGALRAAIEAAIAAWVKPTRAESARARWDAVTPEQRKLHTIPALKGRSEKRELKKVDDAR